MVQMSPYQVSEQFVPCLKLWVSVGVGPNRPVGPASVTRACWSWKVCGPQVFHEVLYTALPERIKTSWMDLDLMAQLISESHSKEQLFVLFFLSGPQQQGQPDTLKRLSWLICMHKRQLTAVHLNCGIRKGQCGNLPYWLSWVLCAQ